MRIEGRGYRFVRFVLFKQDLCILRAQMPSCSGFATFVYLHTIVGASRVHRLACLAGPPLDEAEAYQGFWPELAGSFQHTSGGSPITRVPREP